MKIRWEQLDNGLERTRLFADGQGWLVRFVGRPESTAYVTPRVSADAEHLCRAHLEGRQNGGDQDVHIAS